MESVNVDCMVYVDRESEKIYVPSIYVDRISEQHQNI